ncbi:hypothetical protein [Roseitalea sp. MMSF_3504]|uniref:hypothetical protein n=1 Tax=Roseitalea sp. MMSF_3504 TaxID=3046716 RepID=UPI00273E9C8F|nr:hypothetical protein [Roseitalea sp. MMSF_3504]
MAAAIPQFGAFAPTAAQTALIGLFGLPLLKRGFFRRMAESLVAGLDRIDLLKIDAQGMEDRVLGAFFRDAPKAMWPAAMIVEDELAGRWSGDLAALLAGCGYRAAGRTKGNAFYLHSDKGML